MGLQRAVGVQDLGFPAQLLRFGANGVGAARLGFGGHLERDDTEIESGGLPRGHDRPGKSCRGKQVIEVSHVFSPFESCYRAKAARFKTDAETATDAMMMMPSMMSWT